MADGKLYRSRRIVDGKGSKPRDVIVDESRNIVNMNPSKEELKGLEGEPRRRGMYTDRELLNYLRRFYKENGRVPVENDFNGNHRYPGFKTYQRLFGSWNNAIREAELWKKRYNDAHACDRCKKSFDEIEVWGHPYKEYDEKGDWTGNWDCPACWQKYDHNSQAGIKRSIANRRTGNQCPSHSNTKGDKLQELACLEFGWKDLNKENDNYCSPIDCLDTKTGLFHQVKGRRYNHIDMLWSFGNLEREWIKKYEDMICYCISENGKRIERMYIFPSGVIMGRTCISIIKNPTDRWCNPITPWYEQYRVEEELKKANEIWKEINNDRRFVVID